MAGIGLRLQKMVTRGTYLEAATAYLSSAVIASGPWLTSIVALATLSGATAHLLSKSEAMTLFASITYAFGASLIASGGMQMALTRYLADRLYSDDTATFAPTCSAVLLLVAPLWLIATPFVIFGPYSLTFRLVVASLFVTLTLIWLVSAFLSAARDYMRVLLIFVLAYSVSVVAALTLVSGYGVDGGLLGFTTGQILCLALLVARVYREFPATQTLDIAAASYLGKFWDLALIGSLYMVGIWIDNAIYWTSPEGVTVGGFFHLLPQYDTAKLLAYLTVIPASAVFLVHVETNFYRHYADFFAYIRHRGALAEIRAARNGMAGRLRSGLVLLLLVQGACAGVVILFAPSISVYLGFGPLWVQTLRIVTLAASAQFFLMTLMLMLLYLDDRAGCLLVVSVFALGNLGATLVTTQYSAQTYGLGYLVAAATAALLALILLRQRMRQLEYRTFMLQPIVD